MPSEQTRAAPSPLSECKSQALAQAGVGVTTLGNDQDSLFCGGSTGIVAGLINVCNTQTLIPDFGALFHLYDLKPTGECKFQNACLGGIGHGTILRRMETEQAIVRDTLAPVVTFTSPVPHALIAHNVAGTPISVEATVHCLLGPVGQVQATLMPTTNLAGSTKSGVLLIGAARGNGVPTINVHVTATLSPLVEGPATLTIVASGTACPYPRIDPHALPTRDDYLDTQIVDIVGGLLGTLHDHELDIGWPRPNQPPLVRISISGYATHMTWSPDGTQVAYVASDIPSSALDVNNSNTIYVAEATGSDAQPIATFDGQASPLAWNERLGGEQFLAWDQQTVTYTSSYGAPRGIRSDDLWIYDFQTGTMRRLNNTSTPFVSTCAEPCASSPPRETVHVAWSADGYYLITPIGVVDTAGHEDLPVSTGAPSWSEQGDVLAVPDNSAIDVYQASGNPMVLKKIRQAASYSSPIISASWSPDDRLITTCSETLGLQVVDASGNTPRVLSSDPCLEAYWSPDQTTIAVETLSSYYFCYAYDAGLCGGTEGPYWYIAAVKLVPPTGSMPQTLLAQTWTSSLTCSPVNGGCPPNTCTGDAVQQCPTDLVDDVAWEPIPSSSLPPTPTPIPTA